MQHVSIREVPAATKVCVWLDNMNTTMFLTNCKKCLLITYLHEDQTRSSMYEYSVYMSMITGYTGLPTFNRLRR